MCMYLSAVFPGFCLVQMSVLDWVPGIGHECV